MPADPAAPCTSCVTGVRVTTGRLELEPVDDENDRPVSPVFDSTHMRLLTHSGFLLDGIEGLHQNADKASEAGGAENPLYQSDLLSLPVDMLIDSPAASSTNTSAPPSALRHSFEFRTLVEHHLSQPAMKDAVAHLESDLTPTAELEGLLWGLQEDHTKSICLMPTMLQMMKSQMDNIALVAAKAQQAALNNTVLPLGLLHRCKRLQRQLDDHNNEASRKRQLDVETALFVANTEHEEKMRQLQAKLDDLSTAHELQAEAIAGLKEENQRLTDQQKTTEAQKNKLEADLARMTSEEKLAKRRKLETILALLQSESAEGEP